MEVPQKLKTELPYDSGIAVLEIYPQNTKTLIQRNICTLLFIAALFRTAELWKQPKCPSIDECAKADEAQCTGGEGLGERPRTPTSRVCDPILCVGTRKRLAWAGLTNHDRA